MCRIFFIFTVTSKTTFMTVKRMLCLLFLLCVGEAWGQKWEVNSVRNDYVYVARFDRFVTDKDRTVADVTLRFLPGKGSIQYHAEKAYLQDRESGKKYKLVGAENFELNSQVTLPESGELKAQFIFEPLDKEVKCLDFCGWDPAFQNTRGIWLSDPPMTLPAWAEGAWMTTDGSNRWMCGFFPQVAIWKNDFWEYGEVTKKGRNVWVELRQEGKDTTFCLREGNEGTLLFGVDGKRFDTLGKEFVFRSDGEASTWSYDPEKYRDKLYKKGTTVVRGIFEGYTPDLGFTTGSIVFNDLLTGTCHKHTIDIRPDGRFELEVELEHPRHVKMELNDAYSDQLFVVPGDTLMCRFTLTDVLNPQYLNAFLIPKRMDSSRFMGRAAEYNMYQSIAGQMMPKADTISDWEKRCVERGAADEFKAGIDRRLQLVRDSLKTLASRYAISDWTMDLLCAEYTQRECVRKYFYVFPVEETRFIPSGDFVDYNPNYIPLPDDYFDFYSMDWMDDPLMVTGSVFESLKPGYHSPISPLRIFEFLGREIKRTYGAQRAVDVVADKIRAEHPGVTENQMDSIEQTFLHMADSDRPYHQTYQGKDTLVKNMVDQYRNEFLNKLMRLQSDKRKCLERQYLYSRIYDTMKSYGLDRNLVSDYSMYQIFKRNMSQCYSDSSNQFIMDQMSWVLPYIKTPYVIKQVIQDYADILASRGVCQGGLCPK